MMSFKKITKDPAIAILTLCYSFNFVYIIFLVQFFPHMYLHNVFTGVELNYLGVVIK